MTSIYNIWKNKICKKGLPNLFLVIACLYSDAMSLQLLIKPFKQKYLIPDFFGSHYFLLITHTRKANLCHHHDMLILFFFWKITDLNPCKMLPTFQSVIWNGILESCSWRATNFCDLSDKNPMFETLIWWSHIYFQCFWSIFNPFWCISNAFRTFKVKMLLKRHWKYIQ